MGLQLIRDKELKESLYVHIERALTRIRSGMCISNPLIEDVKKDYEELFGIIREGADRIFSPMMRSAIWYFILQCLWIKS